MAFPRVPSISKEALNRAGDLLVTGTASESELEKATTIVGSWRACHAYPINTFQATLRGKLKQIDPKGLAAQRLKRLPTIIDKLKRYPTMKLARMQDIGGVRAIVGSVKKVRELEAQYRDKSRFAHELVGEKDYITDPATSGYRSVHLIYKYRNPRAPDYEGLLLELQIRSKIQHSWATAVETMSTFLGQALKSSQGEKKWKEFFAVVASAFAYQEGTTLVPGYDGLTKEETFREVAIRARDLRVVERLRGFSVAAESIIESHMTSFYHLVVLDSTSGKAKLFVLSYARRNLAPATARYAEYEARARAGEKIDTVLVSAGPLNQLRRAYPNYFLDTNEFIGRVESIVASTTDKTS